jgi:hypothetical protein
MASFYSWETQILLLSHLLGESNTDGTFDVSNLVEFGFGSCKFCFGGETMLQGRASS